MKAQDGNNHREALSLSLSDPDRMSLCEALDRILNKGAVVVGEVTISVAGIDLVYLGLHVMLSSIETAYGTIGNSSPIVANR